MAWAGGSPVKALAIALLLTGFSYSVPASGPVSDSVEVPDLHSHGAHGDGPVLGEVAAMPVNLDRWAAIAILRERTDGSATPALLVVNEEAARLNEDEMVQMGLPVIPRERVEQFTAQDLGSIAWPEDQVYERLAGAALAPGSHLPNPPITDYTLLPVTAYPDGAEQATSGWYNDVVASFDRADAVITNDVGIYIYRYVIEYNYQVYDVQTRCHMQFTAKYEEGFTHRGVLVAIFSPGTVGSGWWGLQMDYGISHRIWGGSSWAYCTSTTRSPAYIPSTYIIHRPLGSLDYMMMVTVHEFAHAFNMEHRDAYCWYVWPNTHKTAEAFTSDSSEVPENCGSHLDPFSIYEWDYSEVTETKMWGERQRFTRCYNGATPCP